MKSRQFRPVFLFLSFSLMSLSTYAAGKPDRLQVPKQFVAKLYQLHQHVVSISSIRTESENGGYGGIRANPNYFKEVRYLDKNSGRLLSMIQWEVKNPKNIHTITVNIYDPSGRVIREYTAAYLPNRRKVPFQTLISLYHHGDSFVSSRDFDAHGEILSEICAGKLQGKKFRIVLDDYEIPDKPEELSNPTERAAYPACFGKLPKHPGKYMDPMIEVSG